MMNVRMIRASTGRKIARNEIIVEVTDSMVETIGFPRPVVKTEDKARAFIDSN